MQNEITRVVFRKWNEDMGVKAGRIFALFPEIPAGDHWKQCQSYEQGQYGASKGWYMRSTRPATPEEYVDLKEELEKMGYRLEVVRRISPVMVERRGQAAKLEQFKEKTPAKAQPVEAPAKTSWWKKILGWG